MNPHSINAPDPARHAEAAPSTFSYERWAIPYKFQPVLSVSEAAIAALLALARIFLFSILFGAWGAFALRVWFAIGNSALRIVTMIPIVSLFIVVVVATLRWTARRPLAQR